MAAASRMKVAYGHSEPSQHRPLRLATASQSGSEHFGGDGGDTSLFLDFLSVYS
jgi:hypothetical protein